MQARLYYQLTIRDARGRVLRRTHRRRARSYVRQFADLLYNAITVSGTATDTGGTSRTLDDVTDTMRLRSSAALGNTDRGLVVGTGTTSVDISDYELVTLIAHGVGAGQLQYQAETYTAPSVTGATASFKITRVFINGSGASITIQEVGIKLLTDDNASTLRSFLVVRDLVAGGQVVPDGGSATLEYTISVTA